MRKCLLIMHFVFTMWIFLVPKLYPISLLAARVWQRWFIQRPTVALVGSGILTGLRLLRKKNRRSNANWLFCLVSFLLFLFKDINRYHIDKTTLLPLPSYNPTHFDSKNIYWRHFFFHDRWGWNKPDSVMWGVIKI